MLWLGAAHVVTLLGLIDRSYSLSAASHHQRRPTRSKVVVGRSTPHRWLPQQQETGGAFDVTAFGADPLGRNDSTAAINAALAAAVSAAENHPVALGPGLHGRLAFEVIFPAGTYVINGTLNLSTSGVKTIGSGGGMAPRLRGVGMPSITQLCANCDIFFGDHVYRAEISHLWLRGGRHQLYLGNNNTDQGNIFIHNCEFDSAGGVGIHIMGPSCLQPSCPEPNFVGSYSTQVVIRDCRFHHCNQAFINWADWSTMEQCWISTSCAMQNKAVIENHDKLFLRDILGVPCNPNAHNKTDNRSSGRWIDNYSHRVDGGFLHAQSFRFGGESGGKLLARRLFFWLAHSVLCACCASLIRWLACLGGAIRATGSHELCTIYLRVRHIITYPFVCNASWCVC
jgi:hypothetical protein